MAFDLVTAKTRLKITDALQDVQLQGFLDIALDIVEKYLDRKLMYKRETQVFHEVLSDKVWVERYPIDQVFSVDGKTISLTDNQWDVNFPNGWVKGALFYKNKVSVDYSGGYKSLPVGLEWALWQLFDSLWQDQTGGAVVQAGAIESVTLADVGTVRFSTGSGGAGSGGGGGDMGDYLTPTILSVLDLYRRESC